MAGGSSKTDGQGGSDRVRIPAHVVYRSFEEQTVLLNLRSGQYHSLNRTAARMLELLERCGDTDEAAARIVEELDGPPDEVSRNFRDFCSGLVERGLLERDVGES